ncbi:MAG: hypothetical protein ACI9S9_004011, partial [Planctomycetota bacterium]
MLALKRGQVTGRDHRTWHLGSIGPVHPAEQLLP